MVQSPLRRLVNKSQFAPHQVAVGVETFAKLNLDHISRDLKLAELGQERGIEEDPPKDQVGLDDIEERVVGYIRQKQAEAQAILQDQLQLYNQRLAKCGFHSVVVEIEDAAKSASAEIETQGIKAKDVVGELRSAVLAAKDEWTRFRQAHGIDRPARYPHGVGAKTLHWGIIVVIVLIEAALNGVFFAQGSDLGLLGGVVEAALIAAFNVTLGLAAGNFPARWATHRSAGRKAFGIALLLGWAAIVVAFNLAVGHYRNAMEAMADDPATRSAATFMSAPLDLQTLQAWMLFGVGLFFCLVAFADGRSMDDPYPGYGHVDRRLEKAKNEYVKERGALLDEIGETYQEGIASMSDRASQIGKRRDESEAILAGIESLRQSYLAHLQYLERCANDLLELYRDANRKARPRGTAPAAFRKRWKHDFDMPDVSASRLGDGALQDLIEKADKQRKTGEKRLEKARLVAAEAFPELGTI